MGGLYYPGPRWARGGSGSWGVTPGRWGDTRETSSLNCETPPELLEVPFLVHEIPKLSFFSNMIRVSARESTTTLT